MADFYSLAYAEMRLILARVIWNFNMELQEDSQTWNVQKANMMWLKGSLNVRLVPVLR